MKSKIVRILFFVLLFVVQVVISDYLNLGPYVYICLIPFIILNIPFSRDTGIVMVEAFAISLCHKRFARTGLRPREIRIEA